MLSSHENRPGRLQIALLRVVFESRGSVGLLLSLIHI